MPLPGLAITPPDVLRILELATLPTVIPPQTKCSTPRPPGALINRASGGGDLAEGAPQDGSVDVTDLPTVGPFDNELIQAGDAQALIDWLNTNGYLITAAMEPAIADYVAEGLAFLGVKLTPGADVAEIQPLSITWPGTDPMIPLRLTAIAAEPEMGILVFVLGGTNYESTSWLSMELDIDRLQANPMSGQNNYHSLLSLQLDEVGGQGFITEMSANTSTVLGLTQTIGSFAGSGSIEDLTE